mgnify:CR=1 FL=1
MTINRNQQHYIIMTVIYDELTDFVIGKGETFRDARDLTCELCECSFDEVPEYIKETISYAINNYGKIREAFIANLKGWAWDRLPLLTQSVLLMSYAHKQIEEVEKKIVINIAVDLAKKYIDPKQAKFINAILDKTLN